MPNHDEMVRALADAMGIPSENVASALRAKQQSQSWFDAQGNPLFPSVDSQTSDEGLVREAFRNIDMIRKVTGR